MVTADRVIKLFQTIIVFFLLGAGVEYFKYSTRVNYDWFHCTPQVTEFPNSSLKQFISVGGPSCDIRGQLKSVTKKISRTFEPSLESVISCIHEENGKVVGYASNIEDEHELIKYCSNVIHW